MVYFHPPLRQNKVSNVLSALQLHTFWATFGIALKVTSWQPHMLSEDEEAMQRWRAVC